MNDFIQNSKIIYDYFGYFPNFHDDEILSVYLERSSPDIEVLIKSSQRLSKADIEKDVIKNCKIKLKFSRIKEMELKDFNNQNVIYDILFEQSEDEIKTRIRSSYDLEGSIISSEVSVISLDPLGD